MKNQSHTTIKIIVHVVLLAITAVLIAVPTINHGMAWSGVDIALFVAGVAVVLLPPIGLIALLFLKAQYGASSEKEEKKEATDAKKQEEVKAKKPYRAVVVVVAFAIIGIGWWYIAKHPATKTTETEIRTIQSVVLTIPRPVFNPPPHQHLFPPIFGTGATEPALSGTARPTLRIVPETATVRAAGFAHGHPLDSFQFRAYYDPDGPDEPAQEQDISHSCGWEMSNPTVAAPMERYGRWDRGYFGGIAEGETTITAKYQGIQATSRLKVER